MSEAKHTPGPWHVDSSMAAYRVASDSVVICELFGVAIPPQPAVEHANAHLIAAAPELLEALEEMVAMMDCGDEPGAGSEWHAKAVAVIAEAKGDTPC